MGVIMAELSLTADAFRKHNWKICSFKDLWVQIGISNSSQTL
jgi:hypothetical protein